MSYITAYGVLIEPFLGKLPVFEVIESLYDHVDEFVVLDCSKYDRVDLSKYGKVRKHVKALLNPFDNPLGSAYTTALRLVESDTALFLDFDECWEFKSVGLRDIIKQVPLDPGVGVAFSLLNYHCSRNFIIDGCSSKGSHVFKNNVQLYHDIVGGYWEKHNNIRRTNLSPDSNDGVRLVFEDGRPTAHYNPIPLDLVTIHHTSHLDPIGKQVRSIVQYNHTSTIDLPDFYPFDMRIGPDVANKIYDIGNRLIDDKDLKLYTDPIPFNYEPNALLEKFIKRCNIKEFDPTLMKDYPRARAEYAKKEQICQ